MVIYIDYEKRIGEDYNKKKKKTPQETQSFNL